jgi:hypothetical protein
LARLPHCQWRMPITNANGGMKFSARNALDVPEALMRPGWPD